MRYASEREFKNAREVAGGTFNEAIALLKERGVDVGDVSERDEEDLLKNFDGLKALHAWIGGEREYVSVVALFDLLTKTYGFEVAAVRDGAHVNSALEFNVCVIGKCNLEDATCLADMIERANAKLTNGFDDEECL